MACFPAWGLEFVLGEGVGGRGACECEWGELFLLLHFQLGLWEGEWEGGGDWHSSWPRGKDPG